jgi:hypothetical protein
MFVLSQFFESLLYNIDLCQLEVLAKAFQIGWCSGVIRDECFLVETFKSQFQKEVEAIVRTKPGTSFGFIGDAFIPPTLITKYNLSDGQTFKGQIIKTYDSKKKKWGWKLV